jgi:hypothetical protein
MSRVLQFLLLVAVVGCSRPPVSAPTPMTLAERIDRAEEMGSWFLSERCQNRVIRSDVYATFKDGTALTPLVVCAWYDNGQAYSERIKLPSLRWLADKARPDGTIDEGPDGLPYPVYTAALTLRALHHPDFRGGDDPDVQRVRAAWLKYLLDRQLTERNGWKPEDKQYGGWGYYPHVPKKPAPGQAVPAQQLLESNLSATTFALDALHAAGVTDPKVLGPARRFVESCQNDDGGFHFIYDDPVRNKAGQSDPGPDGKPRFHSYGSTTADGARAAWICDPTWRNPDPPGTIVARGNAPAFLKAQWWLEKNFTPDKHPGTYVPTHEPNRNAVYYYYCASVAKTFRLLGVKEANGRPWAGPLAEALLARQRPDGSWANPVDLVRENDPVVATAYALTALAECRKALKK